MKPAQVKELMSAIYANKDYVLSNWEISFLKSLQSQVDLDVGITGRQWLKLQEVYRRVYEK